MIPCFDTSYLVRLYLEDRGYEEVRARAGLAPVAAAWHGQAETVAALHRACREGRFDQGQCRSAIEQFISDSKDGLFHWLPLTDGVQQRLEQIFLTAPADAFLRGADALHLACAVEHGYTEIHSNDRHLLAAAPLFGLRGVNLIAPA
jgi:predicted nucleic acid-binding protein